VLTQTAPESIACGTPAIAFDRGGVIDVVRHMETGYRARFGDIDDLAAGLRTLLSDDELLGRLGRRCREVAEQEFSVAVQVRRYAQLYEELCTAA
jgi:glycosyltransferase involved in cell wall biosynthesis